MAIWQEIRKFTKFIKKRYFEYYVIGPRNKYVPLDILNMCKFCFGLPGFECTKDEKTAEEVDRLRRPTSSVVLMS